MANVALQQTMQQMTEAHAGWRQAESDATKRLQGEVEPLRGEWVEAKATLGRERERAADAKREADVQLALAQEATASEAALAARAREEVARLEGQLATTRQLHETLSLQLRELQEQRASVSKNQVGESQEQSTVPKASSDGGRASMRGPAPPAHLTRLLNSPASK